MRTLPSPEDQPIVAYQPPVSPQMFRRDALRQPWSDSWSADTSGSLAGYWQILMRRRWTVLILLSLVTASAVVISFRTKPVYKSTARIEVEADGHSGQGITDALVPGQTDAEFLRTQIQILQSDNLAWRTVSQLGLVHNPAFGGVAPNAEVSDAKKTQLIRKFKSQLSADLVPGSRVIVIGFESTDPVLAAREANALVESYTDYNFREKYDITRDAAKRMEQQLGELKGEVEKSQRELVEYERTHAIAEAGVTEGKENMVEQRLAQLTADLTQAQNERIQREVIYNQAKSNPEQVHSAVGEDLLSRLRAKVADLSSQYVAASNQYGPNYPKVVRLHKDLEEAEAQVAAERKHMVDRLYNDYAAAKNHEASLAGAVAQQKSQLSNYNQRLVEQNLLKGEFETNQQLYRKLLEHLKDATVTAGLRSTNIHVVDPALRPLAPVRPRTGLNILIGLMVGLILGVLGAFVQESLDNSLKTPEEVETLLAVPALAMIPAKAPVKTEKLLPSNGHKPLAGNGNGTAAIALLQNSGTAAAEAYRALRTSVLLSLASHAPQSVLVTSAGAAEGKTTTAINLAVALAQCGSPVLLIDCDLRRPNIARFLELENQRGISTVLTGNDVIESVLQPYTPQPNLSVIPSGPQPPNPAELVSSELMQSLLKELQKRFKHIIIDSPPLLLVTDATILATLAEGTVLVVESGVTPRKLVLRARRILDSANAHMLGVALNKVRVHHDDYGSHYRGYYGYGGKKSD